MRRYDRSNKIIHFHCKIYTIYSTILEYCSYAGVDHLSVFRFIGIYFWNAGFIYLNVQSTVKITLNSNFRAFPRSVTDLKMKNWRLKSILTSLQRMTSYSKNKKCSNKLQLSYVHRRLYTSWAYSSNVDWFWWTVKLYKSYLKMYFSMLLV